MERNYEIINTLRNIITEPICELDFSNNFELLIAVILSAQCTDKRVNMVTKELFKVYDTPEKLASAKLKDVEKIIKPCGFYNNKSKNIIECSKQLVQSFGGQVPSDMDELMSLKGVGRKTANVVRAVGYKIPALAVDTHVFRVSNRLGLANSDNVNMVERQLMDNIPKSDWIDVHHMLILFGRYYCKAISPKCEACPLKKYCNFVKESRK